MLIPGDPAPWFEGRSSLHPQSLFSSLAGRYVLLCFLGSTNQPASRQVLTDLEQNASSLESRGVFFCGVSADPEDERLNRFTPHNWAMCWWDSDLAISRLYGAVVPEGNQYFPHTLVLDPALRVCAVLPFDKGGQGHVARLLQILQQLPPAAAIHLPAPVLAIPRVFEPELCTALIAHYNQQGGVEGGMLSDSQGQTVRVHDHRYKQRTDCHISDPSVLSAVQSRIVRRICPEIKKAFRFNATHSERFIVSCYDAETGGHFRPHRDDTTKGAAHRMFAVTLNLNAEQYEGGDLRFPEFGVGTYRAPTGSAIVFSCSLLHEVIPVTRGKRYAFLPFLYDEQGARIREQNQHAVSADAR